MYQHTHTHTHTHTHILIFLIFYLFIHAHISYLQYTYTHTHTHTHSPTHTHAHTHPHISILTHNSRIYARVHACTCVCLHVPKMSYVTSQWRPPNEAVISRLTKLFLQRKEALLWKLPWLVFYMISRRKHECLYGRTYSQANSLRSLGHHLHYRVPDTRCYLLHFIVSRTFYSFWTMY